jgi:hypothetical protein
VDEDRAAGWGCSGSESVVGAGWVVSVGVGCGFGLGIFGILNWAEASSTLENRTMTNTRIGKNGRLIFASF